MKNIILIAPPAAGKGTQAKLLSEKYNIPHISIGEIMREARNPETEVGRIIIKCQDERTLVPLDITLNLLKERINQEDCKNGYILDGFPRSLEQADEYNKILKYLNKDIGVVLFMDIDKETALKRTLSRVVCPKCGETYNLLIENLKPKKENICDKCGSDLQIRSDDNEKTFIKGFETYMNSTLGLIEYYEKLGCLRKIDVREKSVEAVFEEIEKVLND